MVSFAMKSYDKMFGTESESDVVEIPISDIVPFKDHPFKVINDDSMQELVDSIKLNGVIDPAIVRERGNGQYELISGHRRKFASELAGKKTLRCHIVDLSDEEATVFMVDSNLHRTSILPSEKAFSYKMRLDAVKSLKDRGSGRSHIKVAEEVGESRENIRRYIRLTELNSDLLDCVDNELIKLRAAISLSYLNKDQQQSAFEFFNQEGVYPSTKQAETIRELASTDDLTKEALENVMRKERKKKEVIKIPFDSVRKYFPEDYTSEQIFEEIVKYFERRSKDKNVSSQ